MRILFAIALLVMGGCVGCASVPHETAKSSALRLEFANGRVCSATAIAQQAILSAAHCFDATVGRVKVSGVFTDYRVIARDDSDHMLVRVAAHQRSIARMGGKARQGQRVFVYGSPAGMTDVLRFGTVAHVAKDGQLLIDATIWRGDSGAAIFDESGRVIGMVSAVKGQELFYMAVAFPLGFTNSEWAEARR